MAIGASICVVALIFILATGSAVTSRGAAKIFIGIPGMAIVFGGGMFLRGASLLLD